MGFQPKRQQGIGVTGWIFIIAVTLFFVLLGMKMIPKYLQYYSIVQVLESIAQDPTLKEASAQELKNVFFRRIDINGVYDFPRKGLIVDRSRGEGTFMRVDYEIREPMVGNVDVVMHFQREVKLQRR